MMGHREPIKTGAEHDLVTSWRHFLCYMHRPRVKHGIKRQMSKRVRREAKRELTCSTRQ